MVENVSNGTEVGRVLAVNDSGILNYAIIAGNRRSAFAISNTGLLTTANTIDYETISNYTLTIEVTDAVGNTASNATTVGVIDLDEQPPTITNQSFSVMENVSAGTIVGAVNATDNIRIANYAIIADNIDNAFAISRIGLLTTANTIDYETISNYTLTIEVNDGASNVSSNIITVNIINVSLSPEVASLNPSGVHAVDAVFQGNLTALGEGSDGSVQVNEYGFIYSTNLSNQNTLILEASGVEKTNLGTRNTTGQFSNRIIGLAEGTSYYYRTYAGNDIGTNLGEIREFTTGILHEIFNLSGAADGEQSGVINPGGSHIYNIPLSNTHSYNLTVDTASNILDNLVIQEGNSTNKLYIQAGYFSIPTIHEFGLSPITVTFSETNSGRRYLVLPLRTTNHRIVISNSNVGTENYTLTLSEERGTSNIPVGRLLVDETPMGFFTNNDPEVYWLHLPPNKSNLAASLPGVTSGNACGVSKGRTDAPQLYSGVNSSWIIVGSPFSTGYYIIRIYNNNGSIDYRGCQFRFRLTN